MEWSSDIWSHFAGCFTFFVVVFFFIKGYVFTGRITSLRVSAAIIAIGAFWLEIGQIYKNPEWFGLVDTLKDLFFGALGVLLAFIIIRTMMNRKL